MRPIVEFTDLDNGSYDVSTRDAWLGWLKPSTYGVWVFVDGQYVEYNSEQLRCIAARLDNLNNEEPESDTRTEN